MDGAELLRFQKFTDGELGKNCANELSWGQLYSGPDLESGPAVQVRRLGWGGGWGQASESGAFQDL